MKWAKILLSIILVITFSVPPDFLIHSVKAQYVEPFAFKGVSVAIMDQYYNSISETEINEGSVVDRANTIFFLRFTQPLFPYSVQQDTINCTDSLGEKLDLLSVRIGTGIYGVYMKWAHLPKKNETYTFHIKGGLYGLVSDDNERLPSDISFTFKTNDHGQVDDTYTIGNALDGLNSPQFYSYYFYAEKGQAHFDSLLKTNIPYRVSILNAKDQSVIFDKIVDSDYPSPVTNSQKVDFSLPYTGEYILTTGPLNYDDSIPGDNGSNSGSYLYFRAIELNMFTENAGLYATEFKRYETFNQPFTINISAFYNSVASTILYLDDKQIGVFYPNDDKQLPIQIDPTELLEGFHFLTFVSTSSKTPNNQSILKRRFFVDQKSTYNDLPSSHWAYRPIEIMSALGLLKGRENNLFVPSGTVTREEFATMIGRTLQLSPSGHANIQFADSPSSWAKPYIEAMAEAGYIQGEIINGKRYFFPNRSISRAEATTILGRICEVSNVDITGVESPFTDFSTIPDWAKPSVLALTDADWVHGYEDKTFRPSNTITRAESAKLISKFIDL